MPQESYREYREKTVSNCRGLLRLWGQEHKVFRLPQNSPLEDETSYRLADLVENYLTSLLRGNRSTEEWAEADKAYDSGMKELIGFVKSR